MSKEGSLSAPVRHPIDFDHPDFLNPEKLDAEMRRVFDICHGCRRCFNLCDSFPKLFDMIDESKNEDVDSLSSDQFGPVVDACTCLLYTSPSPRDISGSRMPSSA